MEQQHTDPGFRGARQCDLKKSFKLAVSSLLTSCSDLGAEFVQSRVITAAACIHLRVDEFLRQLRDIGIHGSLIDVFLESVVYQLYGCSLSVGGIKEFSKAFPSFTKVEQDSLHKLFIQVITSLHEDIEDEFESLCLETQVGTALDNVEQLVEEQALNPLLSDKTNLNDVVHDLQVLKESEIQHLKGMLEKVEEQNRLTRARVEVLRREMKEPKGSTDACDKLRDGISSYRTNGWLHDI